MNNSRLHLAELWALVGQDGYELPFTAENGQAVPILETSLRATSRNCILIAITS